MLGDSSAAGYGTESPDETPGVLLACGLAELAKRPVRLVDVSKTGAKSSDLAAQVDTALQAGPHVAVDPDRRQRREGEGATVVVRAAARRSRSAGCGPRTVRWWSAPARTSAWSGRSCRRCGRSPGRGATGWPPLRPSQWSRQAAGPCLVGSLLSEVFRTNPSMWGPDNFHPSVTGYAAASAALLPSVAAAVGVGPESFVPPGDVPGRGVLPIAEAAVQAARTAGTEVAATEVAGRERGPRRTLGPAAPSPPAPEGRRGADRRGDRRRRTCGKRTGTPVPVGKCASAERRDT